MDSKGTAFAILINQASAPVRKERLSPTSKARREASRNKFVEKGGVQDRVKSFREIDSRESSAWVCQVHPKWTDKDKEFDLKQTFLGRNRPGVEREWNLTPERRVDEIV